MDGNYIIAFAGVYGGINRILYRNKIVPSAGDDGAAVYGVNFGLNAAAVQIKVKVGILYCGSVYFKAATFAMNVGIFNIHAADTNCAAGIDIGINHIIQV